MALSAIINGWEPTQRLPVLTLLTLPWLLAVVLHVPVRVTLVTGIIVGSLLLLSAALPAIPVWF